MSVKEVAEAFWSAAGGAVDRDAVSPLSNPTLGAYEEIAPGILFFLGFGNVAAFDTRDGLVMVDTGSTLFASSVFDAVREFRARPIHSVVYTHGHIDHCFGIQAFDEEHREKGWKLPTVIAHKNILGRFARYKMTLGYNGAINSRQFGSPIAWPEQYRYPDVTYDEQLTLTIGGEPFELHHALGETDDATWVWLPHRKVLCTGDMFIWATPNCGNPQKVQRYPVEWAQALRAMDALGAEMLLPGHGPPIIGSARVRQALTDTAKFLEDICEQALAGINAGRTLNDIVTSIRLPHELMAKPYLRPTYDHPLFIVCNLWRRYAGWWDGNPSRLQPAKDSAVGAALCDAAGGAKPLMLRALAASDRGEDALACTLIEFAFQGAPKDAEVVKAREKIYTARAEKEPCLMARNIYASTAASKL